MKELREAILVSTIIIISVVLCVLLLVALSGCQESQQSKVWGQGDLPTEWQGFFGNNNLSRLNLAQTNTLNRQQAVIFGMNAKDPNGQPMRKRGLIERVTTLESLTERVRLLEIMVYVDPNLTEVLNAR